MRQVRMIVGLATLAILAGCSSGKWSFVRPQHQDVVPSGPPPTATALVHYLNDNARRVQSIQCREIDLDCRQGRETVALRGQMVCQKPNNFRLGASVVGHQQVDLGSNNQEFWYWIGKADPPYLFHCSYADFQRGNVQMAFPFQPEWIIEALGMAEYGAPDKYQVVERPGAYELVEAAVGPHGERLRKITVFSRVQASGTQPQITAHILQDANGKEICGAYITEVQQDPATFAILPRRVRLVWPQQQIELKMKLDELTVNPAIDAQRSAVLFTRPTLQNVQSFDLARDVYVAPGQVRRAGATLGPPR